MESSPNILSAHERGRPGPRAEGGSAQSATGRAPARPLRILLIAYRFPPQVGGGVHRPVRLVKFWSREGHDVTVLTTFADPREEQDPSLLSVIPGDIRLERVFDPSLPGLFLRARRRLEPGPGRFVARGLGYVQWLAQSLSVPDRQVGWLVPSVLRALRVCREVRPDVIVPTGPPWTPLVMARILSRMTRLPMVVDYRDAWTGLVVEGTQTALGRHLDPMIESWVLRGASGIVAAHRSIFRDLPQGYQRRRRQPRRLWSPNGYDADDIHAHLLDQPAVAHAGTQPSWTSAGLARPTGKGSELAASPRSRFILSYTGALGGHRNPRTFFAVLDTLLRSGRIDPDDLRVRIAGGLPSRLRGFVVSLPAVAPILEDRGYLAHAESVRMLEESTANLIFIRDIDQRNRHSPGKVYEVFYVGRPVLLFSPEGVTPRLARRVGGCRIAHPSDALAIEAALLDLYDRWKAGEVLIGPDRARLGFYDRAHQARRFARLLDAVCAETTGSPRSSTTGR